ncbi:MAG: glycosyltransferase [Deltaproteobacteria bacterium]|nr:glycosyltransferase [Deltaproteobacteria bacterium]MBW2112687.1 glycosyltransferase [Deltaproteobacteria bacterium]
MKILYLVHQFYPQDYTGTEKFVLNMARMMQRLGHKVKVISYSFYEASSYDTSRNNLLFKEFLYQGIPVMAFKYVKEPEDLHISLKGGVLADEAQGIIAREAPDMVHVGHPMRVCQFAEAADLRGIPFIITLTDFWLICPKFILSTPDGRPCAGPGHEKRCRECSPEFSDSLISERLRTARDLLFHAKGVFSPSRFLRQTFEGEFPGLSVGLIHHGMPFKRMKKNTRSYKRGDSLTFLYAGSFNRFKGLHVLIEAFLGITHTEVSLKIYGSGPDETYDAQVRKMVRGHRRIELCGVFPEDQVGEILSSVDVVVVPSLWYENYPLILHEALACNVPVIASDAGGMAEKIKDRVNGFTFKMGDVDRLRAVIINLVDHPEQLNRLKENICRQMIPAVEQEAYAYEKVYFQVASPGKAGGS